MAAHETALLDDVRKTLRQTLAENAKLKIALAAGAVANAPDALQVFLLTKAALDAAFPEVPVETPEPEIVTPVQLGHEAT